MQNGWILIDKTDGKQLIKRKVDTIKDQVREHLHLIKESKHDQVYYLVDIDFLYNNFLYNLLLG